MIEFRDSAEMNRFLGKRLGRSDWVTVDQDIIDRFADMTGDHQWVHVDVARAAQEMPGGRTIAHGYLLLSLLPRLSAQIYEIASRTHSLHYGFDKVRFVTPVMSGSRVRLTQAIKSIEKALGGSLVTFDASLEIEGQDRPALVAEPKRLVFEGMPGSPEGVPVRSEGNR